MTTHPFTASLRSLSFLLTTLTLLPACPAAGDDDDVSDDDIGESDSTDNSDESDESESSDSDTDDSDTSDDSTDSTDSMGDESSESGEVEPDVEACQQYCDAWYPCFNDQPQDGTCVAECLEDLHSKQEGMCFDNELGLLTCLATLTCEEYEAYLWHEEGEAFPCDTAEEASCQCLAAEIEVGEGETASDCSLDYSCIGETSYAVECDGEGCTCYVDGVETGGCVDAMQTCAEVIETVAFDVVNECCGWSLG